MANWRGTGRHKRMHHDRRRNRIVEPYYCPRCSEPFDHFDELQDHCLDVHKVRLGSTFYGH